MVSSLLVDKLKNSVGSIIVVYFRNSGMRFELKVLGCDGVSLEGISTHTGKVKFVTLDEVQSIDFL